MKELFWLEDRICGRCGPRMCGWNLQELWDNGIRSIICVGDDSLTDADRARYEFEFFEARLPETDPLTENDETLCRILLPQANQFLERQLLAGSGSILIHCFGGVDRTTLLMIYYLNAKYGVDFETGLARLKSIRPRTLSCIGWEDMARRIIA